MAQVNLDTLSYNELVELLGRVQAAIEARKKDEKAKLKRQITEMAASSGFDVEELVGTGKPARGARKGTKVPPKYQHPKDPSLTWAGRGRKPLWLAAELAKGRKPDSFLIK